MVIVRQFFSFFLLTANLFVRNQIFQRLSLFKIGRPVINQKNVVPALHFVENNVPLRNGTSNVTRMRKPNAKKKSKKAGVLRSQWWPIAHTWTRQNQKNRVEPGHRTSERIAKAQYLDGSRVLPGDRFHPEGTRLPDTLACLSDCRQGETCRPLNNVWQTPFLLVKHS